MTVLALVSLLTFNCASSKPTNQPVHLTDIVHTKYDEGKTKGLMELLVSGLVIYVLFSIVK